MSVKKLNILVIEDNPTDVLLIRSKLSRFALTSATTLRAGKLAMSNFGFDCILLDLNLVNGRKETVLSEVNALRGGAATVIVTGDSNPAMRDAMLILGADGFMVKGKDDATREDMEWVIFRALEHREGKAKHERNKSRNQPSEDTGHSRTDCEGDA